MQHDFLKAKGRVTIQTFGEDGALKDERQIDNLVVTVGKGFIASRMAGAASAVMSHMSVGTNGAAPANADTQLGAEIARVALDSTNAAGPTVTYTATFPAGTGSGAIVEAGLFNAGGLNAGTMLARVTFPVINKGANDQTVITWSVTIQ